MIATAVISRYANALVEVVLSASSGLKPADALAQLRAFSNAFQESKDLRAVLASPAISAAKKRAVIREVAKTIGAAPVMCNFMLVLNDHRRAAGLPEIADAFEVALDARLGLVRAEVRSATALSAEQQASLSNQLNEIAGAQVRLRVDVDPSLIGGVSVRIGSKVYDGSVRGQLAGLRQRLVLT